MGFCHATVSYILSKLWQILWDFGEYVATYLLVVLRLVAIFCMHWLAVVVVRALDSRSTGHGFHSHPLHSWEWLWASLLCSHAFLRTPCNALASVHGFRSNWKAVPPWALARFYTCMKNAVHVACILWYLLTFKLSLLVLSMSAFLFVHRTVQDIPKEI